MQTCENCGKEFATVPQLRGHKIHCRVTKTDVVELTPPTQGAKVVSATYKQLPKPIVDFLELEIPNWLDKFEIGQVWKQDFGGYGMYIKVPKEFSTEHREEDRMEWDNRSRKPKLDANGNEITKHVVYEDVRWCPIKETETVISWIKKVIKHVMENGQRKGLQIPATRIE